MTQATPANVLPDFDGTSFAHAGATCDSRLAAGGNIATDTEVDGTATDYRIHSVAGIEPLQQSRIETGPGRLQRFDVVWDTERGGCIRRRKRTQVETAH